MRTVRSDLIGIYSYGPDHQKYLYGPEQIDAVYLCDQVNHRYLKI